MRVSLRRRSYPPTAAAMLVAGAATSSGCYIQAGYFEGPPLVADMPAGDVSIDDFYEPLAAWGDWVDVAPYGRVWVPRHDVVGTDFVPYASGGQWISTDAGWVFQSQWDDAWGWAVYHYGRWSFRADLGWYWIPDVEWGPAWVEWRYGGAYVGWAPMPPMGVALSPDAFVFVDTRFVAEPYAFRYRVPAERVMVVYGATTPSHEVAVRGNVRWSLGPPAPHLAAAGVTVRSVHYGVPSRADFRARAQTATMRARGMSGAPGAPSRGHTHGGSRHR